MKDVFKPLNKEPKSGKEHSLEDVDSEFNKYLRLNFYNVKLSNFDIYEIKKCGIEITIKIKKYVE